MLRHPYILHALKYGTLTLLGVTLFLGVQGVQNKGSLTGRLVSVQQQGVIPTIHIDPARSEEGFSVPSDSHVLFTIPSGVRIARITYFGGSDIDQTVRYWGYCFSGNEEDNKARGLRSKAMYDGQYFYSLAERQGQTAVQKPADNDLVGIKASINDAPKQMPASIAEIFQGPETCYVMSSEVLPAGLDRDGDDLNAMREIALNTNPNERDTDGDGIDDGIEVLTTKTDPTRRDTDQDGLSDGCEEENHNGILDPGETSPLVADTDRDGLCDGNGFAPGCPEERKQVCVMTGSDENCSSVPASPVYGEDMNLNCKVDAKETDPTKNMTFGVLDWEYKWNQFRAQLGNRQ